MGSPADNDNRSYWLATATEPPLQCDHLSQQIDVEVAIVGGGYTGTSAGWHLTRDHHVSCAVLEAERPGFGASGRNGGFCGIGSSKLGWKQILDQFGEAEARKYARAQLSAIELASELITKLDLDVKPTGSGEMYLAHRPGRVKDLLEEQDLLEKVFDVHADYYHREELVEAGMTGPQFHGGLHLPWGFGLHPLNYIRGLIRSYCEQGGLYFADSRVTAVRRDGDGRFLLSAGQGSVRADKLIFATNGYSPEFLSPMLKGAVMPVRSNILTTRPLTVDELNAQGWTSQRMSYDSRNILHYFRLLPDGSFLFGGRGGINDRPSNIAYMSRRIEAEFHTMFPAWSGVEISHTWSGYICLAKDLVPHVCESQEHGIFTAMCYHGSGVAMGTWSGRAIAAMVAGDQRRVDRIPEFMKQPLPKFPVPRLRPLYFKAAYAAYRAGDNFL